MKYKVYFEEVSGLILAISNVDQEFENFFEVDYEDIAKFVDGIEPMLMHKVVYNINTSSYNIIPKESKIELLAEDLIHKITPKSVYQVGFWQNTIKNCWSISLSSDQRDNLEQVKSRPNEQLNFSVTQKNNPNILYRSFSCTLNDLIDNDSVDFNYDSQDEERLTDYSVYTNRKFEKYTCGVVNV